MEKKDLPKLIIKLGILALFLAILVFISIKYTPQVIKLISDRDQFKNYILSFGSKGVLVFIFFMILHVIIVIIPGEIVQIAGGYIYGTFFGTVYSFIGIVIGVVIVFFGTRLLGYSIIKIFISKDKLEKFNFLINSQKSEIIMFLLFLIPGIPKDTLVYISGLTPIKPLRFIVLCSIARFPGLLGSAYIGAKLESGHYVPVIIVSAIAIVLFFLGVIFQQRIVDFIHKFLRKKDTTPDIKS